MTNSKCKYCGEHHHYQHELVCDNVRTLYPLPLVTENGKTVDNDDVSLSEQNKALRNDYMILNSSVSDVQEENRRLKLELEHANYKKKLLGTENYRLKNPAYKITDEEGNQWTPGK